MKWQIMKGGEPTGETFDDGILEAQPGDEAFTVDAVKAHVDALGAAAADGFNYIGPTHSNAPDNTD